MNAVMVYFKVLSHYFPGGIDVNLIKIAFESAGLPNKIQTVDISTLKHICKTLNHEHTRNTALAGDKHSTESRYSIEFDKI
jgi:hypothetical protein